MNRRACAPHSDSGVLMNAAAAHFPTLIRQTHPALPAVLNDEIISAALTFAQDDEAGAWWSAHHDYPGYTSYGSFADLVTRAACFRVLKKALDKEVALFAEECGFDLGGRPLKLDSIWLNVLEPGGFHSGHIHPLSVVSGTYYADVPDGAAAIRFEDPRLPLMMAAPPRRNAASTHVEISPRPGMALFWESWLRHEVLRNGGERPRISVSFNYRWG